MLKAATLALGALSWGLVACAQTGPREEPAATLAPSAATAAAAPAVAAGPKVVRGDVALLEGNTLTVRDGGDTRVVTLTPNWSVSVLKPIAVTAIQPGSFIGTAEMPQAAGQGRSLEVHVFPPGVKMGEGHYGWDLAPGSMMTNGTVNTVVTAPAGGRELEVAYGTEKRRITVPPGVPVVQITGGDRAAIKPGVPVFMVVRDTPNGLMAGSVSIGENGAKPTM